MPSSLPCTPPVKICPVIGENSLLTSGEMVLMALETALQTFEDLCERYVTCEALFEIICFRYRHIRNVGGTLLLMKQKLSSSNLSQGVLAEANKSGIYTIDRKCNSYATEETTTDETLDETTDEA